MTNDRYMMKLTRRSETVRPLYEVFDPTNGVPRYCTRHQWIARLIAKVEGLDWARQGEGW